MFSSHVWNKNHLSLPFRELSQEQQVAPALFCWVLILIYVFRMEICKAGYALHISDLLLSVLITPMCWQWEWLQQPNDYDSGGSSNLLFLFSSSPSRKELGNGREKPFIPISKRRLMIPFLLLFVPGGFHSKKGSRPWPIKIKVLLGRQNETQATDRE